MRVHCKHTQEIGLAVPTSSNELNSVQDDPGIFLIICFIHEVLFPYKVIFYLPYNWYTVDSFIGLGMFPKHYLLTDLHVLQTYYIHNLTH